MTPPRVFLFDAHSHLHRAFHAVQSLSTVSGFPTNALYGFLSIFNRILRNYSPNYVGIVFDSPTPCFRKKEYALYKANRPPLPRELAVQIEKAKEVLDAMGLQRFEAEGFEADDLLATLARQGETQGAEVWVVSVDKDLFQIISPSVSMLRHHLDKEEIFDEESVRKKTGVAPAQIPDYLALVGDSSDNVPGVQGIGQKTAAQLLQKFGGIENLLAHLPEVENARWRTMLAESAEQARLSRRLTLLRTDAPVAFDLERLAWKYAMTPELEVLYRELEFRTFLQAPKSGVKLSERKVDYSCIRTRDQLCQFVQEARQFGRFSIDTETTGLDPYLSQLVGISVSAQPQTARYIPIGHDPSVAQGPQLDLDCVRELLGPLLADPSIEKIFQHVQFDYKILKRAGFAIESPIFDTMLASYLLNPDKRGHGLKALALEHIGVEMTHLDTLIGDGQLITLAQVAVSEVEKYSCQDADLTFQLGDLFAPLIQQSQLETILRKVESPLAPVLADMELAGVAIDRQHFERLRVSTLARLQELERQANQLAGRPFNPGSPKQAAEVLFDCLKLPTKRKGKTGFSTDVEVLEQLVRETHHPILPVLLEYRSADKLLGTYIAALPRMINPETGRIHTSFNQTVAATGRLSSSEPNLQNIPVRTSQGRDIRRGFIPSSPGNVFFSADYSQIELRILAHVTDDASLVEAFRRGDDVHRATAERIFKCGPAEVTDEMRNRAKTVNFGVIYGISPHGLSLQLGISRGEAQRFIQDYFAVYPGVKAWVDQTLVSARQTGEVRTILGRRRFVKDLNSSNINARQNAERIAINTPIQGASADMIKLAMISIHRRLQREGLQSHMILQVHDELIFDAPKTEIDRLTVLVREEMENALPLKVPVRVDVRTGNNWAEC